MNSASFLRAMLAQGVVAQKEAEEHAIINASLAPSRVEEVKKNIIRGWHNASWGRKLAEAFGRIEKGLPSPPGKLFLGFNTLDRKDVYVEESHVSTFDWGEEYGRAIGEAETQELLTLLVKTLPIRHRVFDRVSEIVGQLDSLLAEHDSSRYESIILTLGSWEVSSALEKSDHFDPAEDQLLGSMQGRYRGYPLIVRTHGEPSALIVVDLGRVGVWKQYTPHRIFPEEEILEGEISFMVKPFDRESATQFVRQQPTLLVRADGTARTEEEAAREVLQRVHLRIVEQFDFAIEEKRAGHVLFLAGRLGESGD
jgi:hypothetical protein